MADGNKSESATPKKRRDERKKGNIFLSKDATAVVSLMVTFFTLKLLGDVFISEFIGYFSLCFDYIGGLAVGQIPAVLSTLVSSGVMVLVKTSGVIMGAATLAAIVATFFQTKLLFSTQSIKPKFNRISPLQGFKRLFSMRSVIDALKGILKISVLLYITFRFISGMVGDFFNYINLELGIACSHLFQSTFTMILQIIMAFAALAAFDFYYQWWEYERQMKMTKQEIKEEYKQMEGDPKIKAKIKETQRKMAQSRMMQAVPGADVVIRNPEHLAIALRYKPNTDLAPIVLAMGQDELALRIVKVAEENKVAVIENVALARALYPQCEIGHLIPPDFYGAVADLLVYLYRIEGKNIQS